MTSNAREIAMRALIKINRDKAYSNIEINNFLDNSVDSRDKNLVREIVYGVLENKLYLDYIISRISKIRLRKVHHNILEILRIGIYQVLFMDRIPLSAAVNESVKLAKKYGHRGSVSYVNGVLRTLAREKEKYKDIETEDESEYISIKTSHPLYLVERWIKEFGLDFTEQMCESNNKRPSLNIRANTLKIDKKDLKKHLIKEGYICREGKYADDCIIVENPYGILDSQAYRRGLFAIQDESSMLVAQIMNPKEGSKVLDLCSAPGGKSTHIAQLMNNRGCIISRDIYRHKVNLIDENAERLGIDIIKAEVSDALIKDDELINKFDYCLLDAPCSGFGIIRRKPEIKWTRKEEDIKNLSHLQYNIILNAKDYVKLGGVLVYSTCTIEKQENIMLINRFLRENPQFKLVNIEDRFRYKRDLLSLEKGFVQLYPHIHGTDGFFIAKILRQG